MTAGAAGPESAAASPDAVWGAIDALATMCNDLHAQVEAQAREVALLQAAAAPAAASRGRTTPADVSDDELCPWVEQLVATYGLGTKIGAPERWLTNAGMRAELVGLMVADVRSTALPPGSFELVYWHDALARVVARLEDHQRNADSAARSRR